MEVKKHGSAAKEEAQLAFVRAACVRHASKSTVSG
jgi:hypothetical protein